LAARRPSMSTRGREPAYAPAPAPPPPPAYRPAPAPGFEHAVAQPAAGAGAFGEDGVWDPELAESSCLFVSKHAEARGMHNGLRVPSGAFGAVRAIGALQVAVGHFFTFVCRGYPGLEVGGGNAVLIFLLMSGFVMQVGYAGKGPAKANPDLWGTFLKRRIARVAPLYWASVLISVPVTLAQLGVIGPPTAYTADPVWLYFSLGATLVGVQCWAPIFYSFNGPLWTVSAQVLFYPNFPRWMDGMHSARGAGRVWQEGAAWWGLHFVGFVGVLLLTGDYLVAHTVAWTKLPLFLMGMMAGSLALTNLGSNEGAGLSHAQRVSWGNTLGFLTCLLFAYTLLQWCAIFVSPGLGFLTRIAAEAFMPPVYGTWLLALTQAPMDHWVILALDKKWLHVAGDWSFAFYVFHWPLMFYYSWAVLGDAFWTDFRGHAESSDVDLVYPPLLPAWHLVPLMLIWVLAAAAGYHLVEVPTRTAFFDALMGGRVSGASTAQAPSSDSPPSPAPHPHSREDHEGSP